MADPTTLSGSALRAFVARWRAYWNRDHLAAEANGWMVERGRWGGLGVRDPRFDVIHECGDCHGTGIHCRHEARCSDYRQPCSTCRGRGTVRDGPLADPSVPKPVLPFAVIGRGRHA
jgi:hypothetical protein